MTQPTDIGRCGSPRLRLYKSEKLCSVTAIERLFGRDAANHTASAFPIRAFWRAASPADGNDRPPMRFLVSVPKKRLRHAVDRVKMRRRIREAYRLLHGRYPLPDGAMYDVVFLYVDSALHPYSRIERSITRLLESISSAHAADQES